ncbi:MAG: DNA (cytosine-5-)-methyltransferase [Methanosphaera sp.]|nr:DNA (cytosine-5-)-methyltransferase [Methanosphaera sp.]
MIYKTIDLCAGIGGIRRGFELTGQCKNVFSAEIDKYACATYMHLYHENPMQDISKESCKEKIKHIDYDILLAGFPCQAFSSVGKKEGFEDKTRGTIFFHLADIIKRSKPKAFLLENVEGLITHKKGDTFNTILNVLINQLNYKIIGVHKDDEDNIVFNRNDLLRNSKYFGVPQNRPRVYLVGLNMDYYSNYEDIIGSMDLPNHRTRPEIYHDLNDVISLREDKKYYLSSQYLETLKNHKRKQQKRGNGFGYMVVNDPSIKHPISNALLATGGSGKERNLIYDPQKEVEGLKVKNKKSPINNEGIRLMTPSEWAKLQGFKGYAFIDENGIDQFTFPRKVSNTQLYKQLGNSVSIPVIEEIAIMLISLLDKIGDKNVQV